MKTTKNTFDVESAFVWGPWQKQIQETFDKAGPIIEKLSPEIDPGYIYYLLREQTYIAMNRANADQRKIEQSWVKLCHALETFLSCAFGSKPLREIERALAEAAGEEKAKLKLQVRPEELAPTPSKEMLKALNSYADELGLLRYKWVVSEDRAGGRPPAEWTNDVAFAMEVHFTAKLGTPQRRVISQLLFCAPAAASISMEQKQIRQRLSKKRRENKKPILSNMAYDLERPYREWVEAGAKGPCPSFCPPVNF